MAIGRPKNPELQEKTKAALLDAAQSLLEVKPYKSITIRELAKVAGTQSPMISYYFGSKFGLIEAMVKKSAEERHSILFTIIDDALSTPHEAVEKLVEGIVAMLLSDGWLFKLMQEDTLADNEDLKNLLVAEFSNIGAVAIAQFVSQLKEEGVIKGEVNFDFFIAMFISLMSSAVMNPTLLKVTANFEAETCSTSEWKNFVIKQLKFALSIED